MLRGGSAASDRAGVTASMQTMRQGGTGHLAAPTSRDPARTFYQLVALLLAGCTPWTAP